MHSIKLALSSHLFEPETFAHSSTNSLKIPIALALSAYFFTPIAFNASTEIFSSISCKKVEKNKMFGLFNKTHEHFNDWMKHTTPTFSWAHAAKHFALSVVGISWSSRVLTSSSVAPSVDSLQCSRIFFSNSRLSSTDKAYIEQNTSNYRV